MPGTKHGLLWVAAGASLWGTDTVLRQPLTSRLSSAQIVLGEHLILSVILLPVLWSSRAEWRALSALEWAAVLGVAWGGSVHQVTRFGPVKFTSGAILAANIWGRFLTRTEI